MSFNGNEGQVISLQDAKDLTANYRNNNPNARKAQFYGVDKINQILNQNGCVGIRMYFGEEEDGTKNIVLVGADQNGNDMYEDIIVETGIPCPSVCDSNSPLNQ